MIERIEIANCASYGPAKQVMNDLSAFNFIYGPNGAGKTTVSRLIANEDEYPNCSVRWRGGTKLEALVYNRDFVANNFSQSTGLKGIFTLGEKDINSFARIEAAKGEMGLLQQKIDQLSNTLEGREGEIGKKGELAKIEAAFKDECWNLKRLHDGKLQGALTGYRSDSQKFKDRILAEKISKAKLISQSELENKAAVVFATDSTPEPSLSLPYSSTFLKLQSEPILKKRVLSATAFTTFRERASPWIRSSMRFARRVHLRAFGKISMGWI
jgi:wobble nucleotide-excising tRNase